jgi:hypothetical protein
MNVSQEGRAVVCVTVFSATSMAPLWTDGIMVGSDCLRTV